MTRTSSTDREAAIEANEQGNSHLRANEYEAARACYRRAIELDSQFANAWFNLGIVAKFDSDWLEARRGAERALALNIENREGALWNLGIATTALRDWRAARDAWKAFGVKIPPGDGPLEIDLGAVPIRMRTDNHEVVWCDRIDPARAIVRNIPLPESGRRYGDLLLHDGAPNGYRMLGDRELAVFDELELIEASGFSTYRIGLLAPDPASVEALHKLLFNAGMGSEDWTSSVQILCRACSEGRPGDHDHAGQVDLAWSTTRDFAIASESVEAIVEQLTKWAREGAPGTRDFDEPECVIDARAAGGG